MIKKFKIYNIDGIEMQFNHDTFSKMFERYCKDKRMKKGSLKTKLGDKLCVTDSTVHSWRFGMSGPSSIEMIKELAEFFNIDDYKKLLKERKDDMTVNITERQKDSLKRVYDAIIEFLDEFYWSDGFNDYWSDLCQHYSPQNVENKLYEIAEKEQRKVKLVLQKEYIELYRLDVYEKLEEYVYDTLCDIYDGKLSYAYRFEAPVEDAGVTTWDDYIMALNKINELIEIYM